MPARAKLLRASDSSLHFGDSPIQSSNNLPHSQPKHGLLSLTDTFTCSVALNGMFSCPLHCLSLLVLLHSRFIHPNLVHFQPKSDQIEQIVPHGEYSPIFFPELTRTTFSVTWGHTPVSFWSGSVSAANRPSAQIFTDLPEIGYSLAILHTSALPPTPRPLPI